MGTDRATSSSQDDDVEFDDDQSVVDSMHPSHPHPVAEHDGDFFYDAREPSRRTSQSGLAVTPGDTAAAKSSAVSPAVVALAPPSVPQPVRVAPSDGVSMSSQWLQEQPQVERRLALPEPREKQKSVSLWSIIKECIGKDLTRICLPVYFNEPLSALQRIAEEFEYSSLLDRAAASPKGSPERLMWMAVFAMSGCASKVPKLV